MSPVSAGRGARELRGAETRLRVAETFGSLQGEGPSLGQYAAFVRLGLCNLDCAWCDTPYTWDRIRFDLESELRWVDARQAWKEAAATGAGLLVITGGEPLIQQAALLPLADAAGRAGWRVEIETNATIRPQDGLIRPFVTFNASVKLAGSGIAQTRRIRPSVIEQLAATGAWCGSSSSPHRVTWKRSPGCRRPTAWIRSG